MAGAADGRQQDRLRGTGRLKRGRWKGLATDIDGGPAKGTLVKHKSKAMETADHGQQPTGHGHDFRPDPIARKQGDPVGGHRRQQAMGKRWVSRPARRHR
jgi:hypothetical protein